MTLWRDGVIYNCTSIVVAASTKPMTLWRDVVPAGRSGRLVAASTKPMTLWRCPLLKSLMPTVSRGIHEANDLVAG